MIRSSSSVSIVALQRLLFLETRVEESSKVFARCLELCVDDELKGTTRGSDILIGGVDHCGNSTDMFGLCIRGRGRGVLVGGVDELAPPCSSLRQNRMKVIEERGRAGRCRLMFIMYLHR